MFSLIKILMFTILLTLGCSMDTDQIDNDQVEMVQEPILNGTVNTDYPAAVSLYDLNCTGSLIAPDALLTSARCVYHLGQGTIFTLNAWVMIDGVKRWTTGVPARASWATTFRYPDDSASDIGVITLLYGNTMYLGPAGVCDYSMREGRNKPSCYMRIYAGDLGTTRNLKVYARGANDRYGGGGNVLRRGDFYMHGWSSDRHYFYSTSTSHANCVGDYGGPAAGDKAALNSPYEMLVGTVSTFDTYSGSLKFCARNDGEGRQRFNRSGTKISIIDQALAGNLGRTCVKQSARDANNNLYNFYKCW